MSSSDRGQKTKSLIISVARGLFYENGYRNTSVRAIFDQAGANIGLLNYYFEGKAEIGLIVYSSIRERFDDLIRKYEPGFSPVENFLFSSALEMRLCLENEKYAHFYDELCEEPLVETRLRNAIVKVLLASRDDGPNSNYSLLATISISAIKPALVSYAIEHPGSVATRDYLVYYLDQQLTYLGIPTSDAERLLDRLDLYHVAVVERFTPIMTPLA